MADSQDPLDLIQRDTCECAENIGIFLTLFEWIKKLLHDCRLCPRDCRVNRISGERGWCGAGVHARYYSNYTHYGEEIGITPSHTVYLTGCNLRCRFCHTAADRDTKPSERLTVKRLKRIIKQGGREGSRNINILGGDPMVNLPSLLDLFSQIKYLPPIVWNTNLYCSARALSMLTGLPHIYLVDYKFGNNECAKQLAASEDYQNVLETRLKELYLYEGPEKIIIRHLVLPGHVRCCTLPVLEWIAMNMKDVRVSLKFDYLVMPEAKKSRDLKRFLTSDEICEAKKAAQGKGMNLTRSPDAHELAAMINQSGQGTDEDRKQNVELVISPHGQIYLRRPTKKLTDLILRINQSR